VSVYLGLLGAALMLQAAFFTFEAEELLWNLHNGAAAWENYIIASIAVILLGGFVLGVYVRQRIAALAAGAPPPPSPGAPIPRGEDGFYHPSSEADIVALVEYARATKRQIRCRGAAHSVAQAIYTDPGPGDPPVPNKVSVESPPEGPHLNVMLDRLTRFAWVDERAGIVEVEAGIHLGPDPYDPTHTASLENSLLHQAFARGWGLQDLGGITHQTVGGFTATGSAGGSLTHDLADNILAFRLVDGRGLARWIDRADEAFGGVALSLGLLGIVTRVRLQLNRTYNITGEQTTTPVDGAACPIDLFGPGDASRPSLERFLETTPYTRLLWWPQRKAKRVVIWQARRTAATDTGLTPYREFDGTVGGQLEQMGGAILYTLLGNRGLFRPLKKLVRDARQFRRNVRRILSRSVGALLGGLAAALLAALAAVVTLPVVLFFGVFKPLLRALFPRMLGFFQPMSKGKPVTFHDYYWRSLPMDNTACDVLLGTEFTELFVPLPYTERAMRLLETWFDAHGAAATGYYSTELYAGFRSTHWMHPAHASGEYERGCCRFDFFWYTNNEGMPNVRGGFFQQFWDLFRDNGIPFRLHWGKYLPDFDHGAWAAYYRSQLPRWDDFLILRSRLDPDGIFLTDYWKRHLQVGA